MATTYDKEVDISDSSDVEEKYDIASTDIPREGQMPKSLEFNTKFDDNLFTNTDNADKTPDKVATIQNKDNYEQNAEHKRSELCKYFYVMGEEPYIINAQEPWPKDVKLFQPYEVEQILLPDNANCLAVQAFMKMCDLDFQIESRPNAEFMSPTGKVPFIKCGAFLVAELEGIVTFVGQKGISLTDHLDPEQKADLRAYMALINNVLGSAENYVCWCDHETYREVTKPRNGSVYPWPLNLIQTWSKRSKQIKTLDTLGWYKKSLEEVFQEVETCCQALTDRLENNTYFFGNKFTELDALLYGHTYTLLTTHLPTGRNNFAQIIRKFDKLVSHCKKVDTQVMERQTDLNEWVKHSKSDLNKVIENYEEDKDEYKTEERIGPEVIGDVEKDSDWLLIDKKVDVEDVGDTADN